MNYLAHAYLSFGKKSILTGNMIGDFVKGRVERTDYPEEIKAGLMLHRHIDSYTDQHPAAGRARLLFREKYGLYAGAITDILFDHFLANDPKCFTSEEALRLFASETYSMLESDSRYFPPAFRNVFPFMRKHDWLYGYRNLQGVKHALQGLERRAASMPDTAEAYAIFIEHYYQMTQFYYELIDDVIRFVKIELTQGQPPQAV